MMSTHLHACIIHIIEINLRMKLKLTIELEREPKIEYDP